MAWRMVRPSPWPWLIAAAALAWLAFRGWQSLSAPIDPDETLAALTEGEYRVVRVIDGDTLVLSPADSPGDASPLSARVKLLGIEAPNIESLDRPAEPFSAAAVDFTRTFVREGKVVVRLDTRRVDQSGRMAAYLFVDGQMLNEELLRAGLARLTASPRDNLALQRLLKLAHDEAVAGKLGLWSIEKPPAEEVVEPNTAYE